MESKENLSEKTKTFSIILFLILNISAIIFFVYQVNYAKKDGNTNEAVLPASTEAITASEDIIVENTTYTISHYKIEDTNKLTLIPNFETSKTSDQIREQYACKFLINGGFYGKDGTPIGLFITNFEKQKDFQKNKTLNGILSLNDFGTPRITRIVPSGNLKHAVQSGPVIKENGNYLSVALQNDSNSRRILAGITGENILYFLALYKKASYSEGVKIEDLKEVLQHFELKKNIEFADIINMDGGSASLFYTDSLTIPESRLAGSFFCLTS